MKFRTELINGKKRILITREVSGQDTVKEAVLKVMGPKYKYKEEKVS